MVRRYQRALWCQEPLGSIHPGIFPVSGVMVQAPQVQENLITDTAKEGNIVNDGSIKGHLSGKYSVDLYQSELERI